MLHHTITSSTVSRFDPIQLLEVASIPNVQVEFAFNVKDPISNSSHNVVHLYVVAMSLRLESPELVDMYISDALFYDVLSVFSTHLPAFITIFDTPLAPMNLNHHLLPISRLHRLEAFIVQQTNLSNYLDILFYIIWRPPSTVIRKQPLYSPNIVYIYIQLLFQQYRVHCLLILMQKPIHNVLFVFVPFLPRNRR